MGLDSLTIKDLPAHDRPRERLFRLGPRALADAELIALLLGQGSAGQSALGLAQQLLTGPGAEAGGLLRLARLSFGELAAYPGMGPAKAARVQAAVELGRRLGHGRAPQPRLGSPVAAAEYLMAELRSFEEEHFRALYLDLKSRLLGMEEVSIGDVESAPAGAREIFRGAVRRGATGVIVAHNHPSGDPRPSRADLLVTERLERAGNLLGIRLLDHLVIGDGRYVSLRQEGLLKVDDN